MAYHPQANGLVERFHQSIKSSLRAHCKSQSWISELHLVVLGHRTMPKDNLGTSPAELVFRSLLTVPGKFVSHVQGEPVKELLHCMHNNVADLRPVPPLNYSSHTNSSLLTLFSAKFIFIHHDGHKSYCPQCINI